MLKDAAKQLNHCWMIPSVVFVPAATIQTAFSLSSKVSRNLGSTPKTSTHVLSTSRKHTTGFVVKSFGKRCRGMVLSAACYWPSSHCIPAQKFVSVSTELNHNRSLWMLDSKKGWIDIHSRVDADVTVGSCMIKTVCFFRTIWCCLHLLNRVTNMNLIDFLLRAIEREWKSELKRPRYYVSRNPSESTLQVSGNTLQQVEKFK